jgi:hypothetical protein
MLKLLAKKMNNKQRKDREKEEDRVVVDLSHSEGEEHSDADDSNSVIVLRKATSKGASSGPMDKFCKLTPERKVQKASGISQ